jgi:hypothetical protein
MRQQTIALYTFDELSDTAKENAREWYRNGADYPWIDDAMKSIYEFCDHFGVCIKDYSIGGYSCPYIDTDATNAHFRGLKLKSINRDSMPTGYCLDCDLWNFFFDEFKRTGSALKAFNDSLHNAALQVAKDMEWHQSDECIDEMLTINEYEFTENGVIY